MKTSDTIYHEFCRMVLDDRICEDGTISFYDICAALHTSPGSLNEILERELGMNGFEILYSFQKLLNLQANTHTQANNLTTYRTK